MPTDRSNARTTRAEVQRFFSLTDRLHAQLGAVAETLSPIELTATTARSVRAGDANIEALSFLVLMQAAQSADEDLKAIMEDVKAINAQKTRLGRLLDADDDVATAPDPKTGLDVESLLQLAMVLYAKQIEQQVRQQLGSDLDSMGEMGEMEYLKLQMAMDRLSKMTSTLSNILKKLSDTAGQLVQNLK